MIVFMQLVLSLTQPTVPHVALNGGGMLGLCVHSLLERMVLVVLARGKRGRI